MILPADVEVDWEAKRLYLAGHEMVVGVAWQGDAVSSSWFHLLCGENGWYVELAIFPDGGMNAILPTEPFSPLDNHSAWDVLIKWREGCEQTVSLDSCSHEAHDYCDPYAGMVPGTWVLCDEPTPEQVVQAKKIREAFRVYLETSKAEARAAVQLQILRELGLGGNSP
jgi:hypothetical protein